MKLLAAFITGFILAGFFIDQSVPRFDRCSEDSVLYCMRYRGVVYQIIEWRSDEN